VVGRRGGVPAGRRASRVERRAPPSRNVRCSRVPCGMASPRLIPAPDSRAPVNRRAHLILAAAPRPEGCGRLESAGRRLGSRLLLDLLWGLATCPGRKIAEPPAIGPRPPFQVGSVLPATPQPSQARTREPAHNGRRTSPLAKPSTVSQRYLRAPSVTT
jgi:hypothetical protein